MLKPSTDLTSKGASELIKWTAVHQCAFDKIKQWLTTESVLKLYCMDKPYVIQIDASISQIGAVLLQREDDAELHPVIYASRKLLPNHAKLFQRRRPFSYVWLIDTDESQLENQ